MYAWICTSFAGITCFINSVIYIEELEDWPFFKKYLYILMCAMYIVMSFLTGYLFIRAIRMAKKNITGVEAKIRSFKRNVNQ
jgi:hypothetical protein